MLIPDYMEEFRCIGSDCPDSCCQGWTVAIDQPTYRKYRKVTDPALRERLHRHVVRNRNGARSADQFARIRLDKRGACPFLTEARLCEIQSRLGAAALSHTCRTYPRTVNRVDGVPEMSATLSCPEVARLALLREAGIEFKEVEGQAEAVNRQIQSQGDGSLAAHFWDMRIFAIQTLKDRRFPVWQRLLLVGFATRRLQEAVDGGRMAEIPAILASYRAQIDDGSLAAQIEAIPLRHDIQLGMLKALMGHKLTRIHNARFRACHERFLAGFGDLSGDDLAALGERFQAALARFRPLEAAHAHVLENYLVNQVFRRLFPLGQGRRLFRDYIELVIHFSIVRLYLIGMAGAPGEAMDVDDMVRLIQAYSKVIEHDRHFADVAHDYLRDNGFDSLAHMAVLLRG